MFSALKSSVAPRALSRLATRPTLRATSLRYFGPRTVHTSRPHFSPNLVEGFTLSESAKPARPPPERDGSHPSLFYHLISSPSSPMSPIYALSFLPKPLNDDRFPKSRTIIGWVGGQDQEGDADNVGFQENSKYDVGPLGAGC